MVIFHSYASLPESIVQKLENIPKHCLAHRTAARRLWRKQINCFKSEGTKAWAQIPVTGWSVENWLIHSQMPNRRESWDINPVEPRQEPYSHGIFVLQRPLGSRRQARDRRIRQNRRGATCSRWGPTRDRRLWWPEIAGDLGQKRHAFSSLMTHLHGLFPCYTSKHMIVPCIFGKLVGSGSRFEFRPSLFLSVSQSM